MRDGSREVRSARKQCGGLVGFAYCYLVHRHELLLGRCGDVAVCDGLVVGYAKLFIG